MVEEWGAFAFGFVVGWITYRTLRRSGETVALSNIATVIGAVGGAAVTGLFKGEMFSWYSIGLFGGFFVYLIVAVLMVKFMSTVDFLSDKGDLGPPV